MGKRCEGLSDGALKALAASICLQAVVDYQTAIRFRKKFCQRAGEIERRKSLGEHLSNADAEYLRNYKRRLSYGDSSVDFFLSPWGESLSGLDGKVILERLNR